MSKHVPWRADAKAGRRGLVVMNGERPGEDERAGRTRAHLVLVWARNSHPLTRPDRTLPFARPRHLSHVQLCSRWTTVSTPLSHILAAQIGPAGGLPPLTEPVLLPPPSSSVRAADHLRTI